MADETSRKPTYVADHSLSESFADSVKSVFFDGANLRIEFAVTRMSADESGNRVTTSHPAARVVLPLNGVNDLMQKVSGVLGDLEKQGILRKGPAGGSSSSPYSQQ